MEAGPVAFRLRRAASAIITGAVTSSGDSGITRQEEA
jgi:hypothetical protein